MHKMDNSSEEFSTPKADGRGDGLKESLKKKTTVNALSLNFKNANRQRKRECNLMKSKSVAEITPTKSSRKTPRVQKVEIEDISLIATPRPFPEQTQGPRRCSKSAATCSLFHHALLLAWRHTKAKVQEKEQFCEQLKEQHCQLELQIDVLRHLSDAESSKRNQAAVQVQHYKNLLEHERLIQAELQKDLDHARTELEELKTSLNLSKENLKRNAEQSTRLHERVKKMIKEKKEMSCKVSQQEQELLDQKVLINELENELKALKRNVHGFEVTIDAKTNELEELLQRLDSESEASTSLRLEVEALRLQKAELEERSALLEDDLDSSVRFCDRLREEAICLSECLETTIVELEEVKRWNWRDKTRGLLSTAHRWALVVLPVLFENRLV